jgi:hypothetical protein
MPPKPEFWHKRVRGHTVWMVRCINSPCARKMCKRKVEADFASDCILEFFEGRVYPHPEESHTVNSHSSMPLHLFRRLT